MRRLVFVHGINNEDFTPEQIETDWKNALHSGIGDRANDLWDNVEVRTAYYADVLARETDAWGKAESAGVRMGADAPDADYVEDSIAELYLELQSTYEIDDNTVSLELDDSDEPKFARRMAVGVHKKWLKAITRALEKLVPSAGHGLAGIFLEQAAAYLNKPGLYEKINALVEDQVLQDFSNLNNTVVVGHSLGTVVMYSLLRAINSEEKISQFVTLGSPLGIKIVRKRIGPPFIKPEIVKNWTNGADPEDFVALHPKLDAQTFGPAEITNYSKLNNGQEDAHSVQRYLSQPQIAGVIYKALK
ncbi:hypothetical protein [Roseibium sp. MMSF_3544]|uniref:hypothetical protein n=1 Tax=unclassified Roseibium TaxID=2629323 RepID=UPI00273F1026|nr:hypothetical protein [Roseibium sp. MMSF_3544]